LAPERILAGLKTGTTREVFRGSPVGHVSNAVAGHDVDLIVY
jgi:hypothetical protein